MSTDKVQTVALLASALGSTPRDLDTWWQLAIALELAGESAAAKDALSDLGRTANDLGAVSLAVACALRLKSGSHSRDAVTLLDRVSKTHCKGSKRVDPKSGSVPPAPPAPVRSSELAPAEGKDAAVAAAIAAMKSAAKAARARVPKSLPPTPLLNGLSGQQLETLVGYMTLSTLKQGDVVVDAGDPADALYWIARGSAEVSKDDKLLGELQSDAFFGEIALVGASSRTARVACLQDSVIIEIPSSAIGELALKAPKLASVLAGYARSRLLSNVMRTSELFRRLNSDERRSLLLGFETRFAEADEFLITSGEENNSLFVLVSGRCEVRDGGEVLTSLEVGDGFGEMSMLGRKEATYDVVAVVPTLLLHVSRDKFDEIAMAHPELLAEVYKLLVAREKENRDALVHDATDLVI